VKDEKQKFLEGLTGEKGVKRAEKKGTETTA